MKKLLFSIIASVALSNAQAQIPNFSFENWINLGSYENPDMWGTMNNTTATFSVYTATKASPGNPGNSYLKLTSKTVSATVVNGIAVSGQLDSITMQPVSGFSFTQRPANFTGKWQHMIYGTTQGSILVKLTRWDAGLNQRISVGTASTTLSGMAMSWANFSLPFTYTDGSNPDTCIIVLKASGSIPANNDYLWVDNLAFSGTVTGMISNATVSEQLNVYPNPANADLMLDLKFNTPQATTIELSDINGKLLSSQNLGVLQGELKKTVDISTLKRGTYFIKVLTSESTQVKKIIIN